MSELIISVSGIRGIVGQSLTPDVASRFARAFAAELPPGEIGVTWDGRESGPMLADAICNSLIATGRDVLSGGVAATPTTGLLVRHHGCSGGIQVSASHNPPEYNGMKLFSSDGRVLNATAGERVAQRYHNGQIETAGAPTAGRSSVQHGHQLHAERVLKIIDGDRIRQRQFKILLDANRGAGSLVGQYLLDQLGCDVTVLGGTPDGQFEHPPEPTAENLSAVSQQVVRVGADVGFCQDPDADRLAVVDQHGRYVGEEYSQVLCLDHVLRRQVGSVVTNCASSRMAQDLSEKFGASFFRSAVGEANVVDLMLRQRAIFGGEGNGGPIDPRIGYVRDSFVGMALILDAMAARNLDVSQLVDDLPRYEMHKAKISLPLDQISTAQETLQHHFHDAAASHPDGLRLDWPTSWLLVRPSNTEPVVRIVAEGPPGDRARQLCEEAEQVVRTGG